MLKAFQSLHGYKTRTKSVSLPSFADIGLYRTESKQSKRQFWILLVDTNCSHPSVIPAWQIGNVFFSLNLVTEMLLGALHAGEILSWNKPKAPTGMKSQNYWVNMINRAGRGSKPCPNYHVSPVLKFSLPSHS